MKSYSLLELACMNPDPNLWFIRDLIPNPGRILFYGKPSTCKTTILYDLLLSIADPEIHHWCGFPIIKHGGAVICSVESSVEANQKRIIRLARGKNMNIGNIPFEYYHQPFKLDVRENALDKMHGVAGQIAFEQMIIQNQPRVVAVDPWFSLLNGDENSVKDVRTALTFLDEMIKKYEITVILLHHENAKDDIRGSTAIKGWIDTGIRFIKGDTKEKMSIFPKFSAPLHLKVVKQRDGDPDVDFFVRPIFSPDEIDGINDIAVAIDEKGLEDTKARHIAMMIYNLLNANEPELYSKTAIADGIGLKLNPVFKPLIDKALFHLEYNVKLIQSVQVRMTKSDGRSQPDLRYCTYRSLCNVDAISDILKARKARKDIGGYGVDPRGQACYGEDRTGAGPGLPRIPEE